MSAIKTMRKLSSLLMAAVLLGPGIALADYELNMTQSVTSVGKDMYDIHQLVMWICTVVGIGVFGVIIYSLPGSPVSAVRARWISAPLSGRG